LGTIGSSVAADAQGEQFMTAREHDTAYTTDAADLPALFEQVLGRLAAARGIDDDAASFVVGFAAVAPDLSSLLEASAAEVADLLAEHGANVQEIGVSGVMAIDEGHRAWGFVTLTPPPANERLEGALALREAAVEQLASRHWRAVATIAGERGEA
jgi:hypothetical protein